ncbi:MAG: RNase adapter RapZ [Synergistota bacterium]|nr:RNase adapter RapZ [Synergistota bacterium]
MTEFTPKVTRCVVITGMSGGGKTTALHILEDHGMYAIDNIPPALLPQLLSVLGSHPEARQNGVAAVADVRGDRLFMDLVDVVSILKNKGIDLKVLFLDASNSVLLQRFEETRRRHPLSCETSILDAINLERAELSPVLEMADAVLDSTQMDPAQLRKDLLGTLNTSEGPVSVLLTSFGFKHGLPPDSDYVLDVRFLSNPFYDVSMRRLSGLDEKVQNFIRATGDSEPFIRLTGELFRHVLPLYRNTGKNRIHIAVGCTGGRHRSVAVAEWLAREFDHPDLRVRHRDIDKDQVV